jgi:hypothetical protein
VTVDIGSEWLHRATGVRVRIVARLHDGNVVRSRLDSGALADQFAGTFVRDFDPAPARDLDQRGGDDGGEHASNVRADDGPGECGS